ncbi:MAG: hypothetical protein N5P05_002821 [Chroococcopsis gigantea SAG 12.99]|nr:pentapeptide repeat-containing protein [Chlorogloea purpurea SAG 13.99]MDV3001215.1 hypothetical protein [Chroococcopsis gigantea SAG 12.99]
MRVLASCNRYSEITLTLDPVATNGNKLELYIDLKVSSHTQPLLNGQIQWLITGGQLNLVLNNCILVHSDLNPEFAVTFEDDSTAYLFALRGGDWGCKLGSFSYGNDSYTITGEFFATMSDVSVVETQSLWRHDISPNKYGVLNRVLARFLVNNELHPYLSKVTIGLQALPPDTLPPVPATQALDNLDKLITVIYEHDSDDFALLTGLAGLSIFDDYRGGNLSGCELSGVDFTGANLSRVNLRGANLTDACLSEADLSYARLRGADLSGALLSNANLTGIDGYRCSLALANLIGANLEGANLTQVNLTETNLSGAKVKGATFAENTGMTEELRSSLLSRGAIVL